MAAASISNLRPALPQAGPEQKASLLCTPKHRVAAGGRRALSFTARASSNPGAKVSIPEQWYNLVADLPVKPPPPLHPQTHQPLSPGDLSPLFPDELIRQEITDERFVDIPEEVIDVYKLWRPTPLISSISPKISTILQSHVYPRVGHVFRALARFKSLLLDALGKTTRQGAWRRPVSIKHAISYHSRSKERKTKQHFTWSGGSSARSAEELNHVRRSYYYEPTCNAVVPAPAPAGVEGGGDDGTAAVEYCGYLCWLEEETSDEVLVVEEVEDVDGAGEGNGGGVNEIDRLAEKFIARCHAKFLLEKQESYRRYQEMKMIARSM